MALARRLDFGRDADVEHAAGVNRRLAARLSRDGRSMLIRLLSCPALLFLLLPHGLLMPPQVLLSARPLLALLLRLRSKRLLARRFWLLATQYLAALLLLCPKLLQVPRCLLFSAQCLLVLLLLRPNCLLMLFYRLRLRRPLWPRRRVFLPRLGDLLPRRTLLRLGALLCLRPLLPIRSLLSLKSLLFARGLLALLLLLGPSALVQGQQHRQGLRLLLRPAQDLLPLDFLFATGFGARTKRTVRWSGRGHRTNPRTDCYAKSYSFPHDGSLCFFCALRHRSGRISLHTRTNRFQLAPHPSGFSLGQQIPGTSLRNLPEEQPVWSVRRS